MIDFDDLNAAASAAQAARKAQQAIAIPRRPDFGDDAAARDAYRRDGLVGLMRLGGRDALVSAWRDYRVAHAACVVDRELAGEKLRVAQMAPAIRDATAEQARLLSLEEATADEAALEAALHEALGGLSQRNE